MSSTVAVSQGKGVAHVCRTYPLEITDHCQITYVPLSAIVESFFKDCIATKKKKANIYCELVLSLNYTLYLTLSVCVSSKRVEFIVWSLTWLERMGSFPPPSHCALVNTPLWAQRGLYGRLNSPVKAPEQRVAFSVESRGPFRLRSLTCKNSLGMLGSSHKGPIHW